MRKRVIEIVEKSVQGQLVPEVGTTGFHYRVESGETFPRHEYKALSDRLFNTSMSPFLQG